MESWFVLLVGIIVFMFLIHGKMKKSGMARMLIRRRGHIE